MRSGTRVAAACARSDLFEKLETEEYFAGAKTGYLEAAKAALPDLKPDDVQTVVEALRERIDTGAKRLEAADAARRRLATARAAAGRELGPDPEGALARLEDDRYRREREDTASRGLLAGWKSYLAEESMFLSLFSFLPAVGRKRRLRAGRFLENAGYAEDVGAGLRIDVVEPELRRRANESRQRLQAADTELGRGRTAMSELAGARKGFAAAAEGIGASEVDVDDHAVQERFVDCGIRFRLFLLATHYWEGRWLIEMERLLPDIERERRRTGKRSVVPRWRRRMMLTPCMVSTFATLPTKMTASRCEGGRFHFARLREEAAGIQSKHGRSLPG